MHRASILAAATLLCLCLSHCGRKTPPKPPELARPMPVGSLNVKATHEGVLLSWSRPRTYADGSNMDDLAGFKVYRALVKKGEIMPAFEEIATVPVTDREKFRKAKRFQFLDKEPPRPGVYLYRVLAFSLDHYYSVPATSRPVELKAGR